MLGAYAALTAAIAPASADKVGVAAAVNPDAFSSLSGTPQSQLSIGKSIFYNERIRTTASGLVQVLLIDGSTFTVGPGSELVIDKFVYDPNKQSGEVVASFSKGVMRFVGGKISKNENGVRVKTPAGELAIRGGMVQGQINGDRGIFSFLYGNNMTFNANNGRTYNVYHPGYTLDLTVGTPNIRPTTAADISLVMAALTNGSTAGIGANAGNEGGKGNALSALQQANSLMNQEAELINAATQTQIQAEIQEPIPKPVPSPTQPNGIYAAGIFINLFESPNEPPFGLLLTPLPGTYDSSAANFTVGVAGCDDQVGCGGGDFSFAPDGTLLGVKVYEEGNPPDFDAEITPVTVQSASLSTSPDPFPNCKSCDFLKWGTWEASLRWTDIIESESVDDGVDINGNWVAGDIATQADLPSMGSATYAGGAVGQVYNGGNTYERTGDMSMSWNFASRTGELTISNFDDKTFSGTMSAPGAVEFSGDLSGSNLTGNASGAFVNKGDGVMGNFAVSGESYAAGGVFGGVKQ